MSAFPDTLWFTRCPVPTGLGIALQKGWFESAFEAVGSRVGSLRESDDVAVRESHYDHTLRHSVRHGGSYPAIWARSSGSPTRVIGLSWADEAQWLLTRPESGIRELRELKGRRFGLPRWIGAKIDFTRAGALRALENALRLEGLEVSDVEIVDYDVDAHQGSPKASQVGGSFVMGDRGGRHSVALVGLLRGEVDAIFLKGAQAVQMADAFGLHVIFDTGSHPDPLVRSNNGTPRTLTVDDALLQQHPAAVAEILRQVSRAEAWAQQNPEEVRRFLARESNCSEYAVVRAYGEDAHLKLRTGLPDEHVVALQSLIDFLHRWQFIPALFSAKDWIADLSGIDTPAPALATAEMT